MLWALGFAIGVVAWAAGGWVVVHGIRTLATALALRAATAQDLRLEEEAGAEVRPLPAPAEPPAPVQPGDRLAA
jgi:hypothetical protein